MRKALEVFVSIWNDEIQECSVLNNTKKGEGWKLEKIHEIRWKSSSVDDISYLI